MNPEGILVVEPGRARHRLGAEELLELGRSGARGAAEADHRPFLRGPARTLGQARTMEGNLALFAVATFAFGAAIAL